MGIKSAIAKPYAALAVRNLMKRTGNPHRCQDKAFQSILKNGARTVFGADHHFREIKTYSDFKEAVPLRDYEGLKPYFDRTASGEPDVLWPGKPLYLCKTSGTTSGAKFIPITRDSVGHHVDAAKMALLCYINETGNSSFLDGKMMFLQGSPKLEMKNGIPIGRLSGITAHWVPKYLQKNRMPSWDANLIDDWETKVDAIVEETLREDMRLISGIPSWVQMYFEKLIEKSGKKHVKDVFPNFSLFVHGGVNYAPYAPVFDDYIGKKIDTVETYPASEGFIAFQDRQNAPGLLLNVDAGMFFEFVPADKIGDENPPRLSLDEVETGVNYAIILNTNAGLFGYIIGDTVKFVSVNPYRIVVTGRTAHYTSAFGEHVIAEEVEEVMKTAMELFDVSVREFHLAPQIKPDEGLPYHEWFVEFEKPPANMDAFRLKMDALLQEKNPYYKDLITGHVLKPLVITEVRPNGFNEMMKQRGKLGGQNKIPRLSNDRNVADLLLPFVK